MHDGRPLDREPGEPRRRLQLRRSRAPPPGSTTPAPRCRRSSPPGASARRPPAAPRASSPDARTPTAATRSSPAARRTRSRPRGRSRRSSPPGRNPDRQRRNGARSPIAYLRSLVTPSGKVRYSRTSAQTPVWVTAQALAALARKPFPLAPVPRARKAAPPRRAARRPRRRRRAAPEAAPNRAPKPRQAAAPQSRRLVGRSRPPDARRSRPDAPENRAGRGLAHRRPARPGHLTTPDHTFGYGSRPLRIGVPTETAPGERRVALVPDIVRKLTAAGPRGRDRGRRGRERRAARRPLHRGRRHAPATRGPPRRC